MDVRTFTFETVCQREKMSERVSCFTLYMCVVSSFLNDDIVAPSLFLLSFMVIFRATRPGINTVLQSSRVLYALLGAQLRHLSKDTWLAVIWARRLI